MTGDGTLKTTTDITMVHTALEVHGTGADITVHISVHTGLRIGTAGVTVPGDITAIATLGTLEDTTIHGTAGVTMTHGTMEDIGAITTHGITTDGMTRTITTTITTTDLHTSAVPQTEATSTTA